MKTLLLVLLTLSFANSIAQDKISDALVPDLNEWGKGSIMLNDNTELKGMIRYNDRTRVVSFESGTVNRSFNARSIQGFEFFDENTQRQRVFFTQPFEDEETGLVKPFFFEVLQDLNSFVVLSLLQQPQIKVKTTKSMHPEGQGTGGTNSTTVFRRVETVYILTPSGDIQPFMKITQKISDGLFFDHEKKRKTFIDRNLFDQYFIEPGYSRMKEYAEANDLEFSEKEDFIKILEEYKKVMVD